MKHWCLDVSWFAPLNMLISVAPSCVSEELCVGMASAGIQHALSVNFTTKSPVISPVISTEKVGSIFKPIYVRWAIQIHSSAQLKRYSSGHESQLQRNLCTGIFGIINTSIMNAQCLIRT